MSRLPLIDSTTASDKARALLDKTQAQLGLVPNLYRALANSPAALSGYLAFREALQRGRLAPRLREQLALVVAQVNHCEYCVSAHSLRGAKIGISSDELNSNRRADSIEPMTAAALKFARSVIERGGNITDADLATVRDAGFDDEGIAEIVAHIALNTYSNFFNHVAQPELDFPRVEVELP
jgi:uncharacterized peroxidase-related enzyme